MLPTNVFLDSPSSLGGGSYQASVFFLQLSLAKYLNVGDYIEDTAGNQYEVTATSPSPFSDGGTVTMSFITTDTLPLQDVDYDSAAFTPGQVDVRPAGSTDINIDNAVVFNSLNYEYTLDISVGSLAEANNIVVGDSIVDINGKEFEITFIDGVDRFNTSTRASEVHKEGILPALGAGSMYTATANIDLYRGTPIADPSRTIVRNRDNFIVDQKVKEIEDQLSAGIGSGDSVKSSMRNLSGSLIPTLTGVTVTATGQIKAVDVSNEAEAFAFTGVSTEPISDSASGTIIQAGRLESITTAFNFQDAIFIAKDGSLTNIAPSIGVNSFVAGDFVLYVGTIKRNETTPANKDLILNPQIVGQL